MALLPLELKTRAQFVQDEISAIQAALPGNFQFPIGSIVRAIVDAHGATALWEESLVQFVLARTRLATSTGADADSFVADFGLKREKAKAASGNVTFSSFDPSTQRLIEVGKTVSTQDNSVSFAVIADSSNPAYNPSLNAYVMAVGASSLNVLVQATTSGEIGNVTSNKITVINSPIVGVDTVNNSNAFSNGRNQQTDSELRKYFIDYINSLARATKSAIGFAIESVQEGLLYTLVENTNYDTDEEQLGYFYAVIDDGSGNPPASLIDKVENATEEYRGFTIRFDVKTAVALNVDITANVVIPDGVDNPNYNPDLVSDIEAALSTYISLIPFGETLFYTRIAQIIYNVINADLAAIEEEVNVTNITLNGSTSDLPSTFKQKFRADQIEIFIVSS